MQPLRFASTKIQAPRLRSARVERPALDAALLRAIRNQRVVLLQAPAGFGKTSLLATLVAQRPSALAVSWVSLDVDDDAERLFACLVAALEPLDLPWRTSPDALVELAGGDDTGLRRAVAELVNAMADSGVVQGALVLDDVHRVEHASAFRLLDALIAQLPPSWALVLSSRTMPPLALARLRAGGELAEFTQDELRFTPDESAALLRAEALPAEPAAADDLFRRTAGWPAGLRLALTALRTRGGSAAGGPLIDRHLFDYLAAEVLDDMPQPLHDFLLRCAVLPELTASRAAAVSGDARASEWLDEIERRGLFATPLDAQERTLVLHDLFRNALLQRLRERLPGEEPELLKRAATGESDVLRRVGFLLRALDWAAADAVLSEHAPQVFVQGGAGEVLRLVEQFPPEHRSARLCMLAGAASGLRWQWTEMARWYTQAVQVADRPEDAHLAQARLAYALYPVDRNEEAERLIAELAPQPLNAEARAALLMADCYQHFRRGQHEVLPVLYAELMALLERQESLYRWWELAPPFNWSTIAGMAPLLERYLAGALPRLGDQALPMRGELRLLSAVLLMWQGQVDDAEMAIAAAEDDMDWLAVSGEAQVGVRIIRAILSAIRGDADAVQERLQALLLLEEGAPRERRELWRHQISIYGVRLADTVGDVEAFEQWASQLREDPLRTSTVQNPRAIAVRARFAAAQGRWADAMPLFETLLPKLAGMDVMGQRTDLSLRAGHALLRGGRIADAAQAIAPTLDRLLAQDQRGQALLCGQPVLQTLAEARWGPLLTPAQRDELAATAQLSAQLRGTTAAPARPAAVDEGLSAREREVLERIAAGHSNKIIARDLDISPHTVKRHVANILDKLGLTSRGQAGAWLHEHGGGKG